MPKKSTQKVKHAAAKSKKNKVVKRAAKKSSRGVKLVPERYVAPVHPLFAQAVQNYEAALKAMQNHKFDRAVVLLEKIVAVPGIELADRARMYIQQCKQQMAKASTSFKTAEEHFDFAVSLMNSGDFDSARSHLEKLVKQNPKSGFVHYGMAALHALQNRAEESMRFLDHAIKLDPAHRYHARNDSDFHNLVDDPRFTELIYPEPGPELVASSSSSRK